MDGVFLIRLGERVYQSFEVSFRAEEKVKHCCVSSGRREGPTPMGWYSSSLYWSWWCTMRRTRSIIRR
jgi:hypothetical protein